jgi:hypothetical protein
LSENNLLIPLLFEACARIMACFDDTKMALEVLSDPEAPSDLQLVVYIQTHLPPNDAIAKLDQFDDEWWLEASQRADGKLCIHIEYP